MPSPTPHPPAHPDAAASKHGCAVLVCHSGLHAPERAATLFVSVQAMAALDLQVELYFTGHSVQLLQKEYQTQLIGYADSRKDLAHYLRETTALGVRLLACAQALHHLGLSPSDLSAHCAGLGGVVQFAARCAEPGWQALVF